VLNCLAAQGLDVRPSILTKRLLTPLDLQQMTAADQGALYGLSFNDRLAPFRRPPNRARGIANLFYAGGTTHPGGGVPMVMLSGKLAAQAIQIG
jgi:phytoene dehydrogenase-like protein